MQLHVVIVMLNDYHLNGMKRANNRWAQLLGKKSNAIDQCTI
jgi:hypothetical protein